MAIIAFMVLGYAVTLVGSPLYLAAIYVAFEFVPDLIKGVPMSEIALESALILIYTTVVYCIIHRFSDSVFKPLVALVVGAVVMFFAPLAYIF